MYLEDKAVAFIENTNISGNRANIGTALSVQDNGSFAHVFGSYINENGENGEGAYADNYVISASYTSISIKQSTITGNDVNELSAIILNNQSSLNLNNSIIYNSELVLKEAQPNSIIASCTILNEDTIIQGPSIYVEDPGFVDAANQNYHLASDSFAIDLCESNIQSHDTDGDPRNWDNPSVINAEGSFDAGADEYFIDVIFSNNFEDTTQQ